MAIDSKPAPVFLGSDAFLEAMQRKVPHGRNLREVSKARRRQVPRSLPEYDRAHADRDQAIEATYASGGYTMQEIGDYFGLHHSRISKTVQRVPRRGDEAQVKT